MTTEIQTLTQLCVETPLSLDKIQRYILDNKMDGAAVTYAAIQACNEGDEACGYYMEADGQLPAVHPWEPLFDLLLDHGLDVELVIRYDEINDDNILMALHFLDCGNLNARLARKILSRGGTPNVPMTNRGITAFEDLSSSVYIDIAYDTYYEKRKLHQAIVYWMVLVGFGGKDLGNHDPVTMQGGHKVEILQEFERFTHKIVFTSPGKFDLYILDKQTQEVVAIC